MILLHPYLFKWTGPLKHPGRDFPGGLEVKNPPSNAGDGGLTPGQGTKIPHAVGCATTREPACCNYWAHELWSPRATTREKPARHKEEPVYCNERPCMPQWRSRVLQLRPDAAK